MKKINTKPISGMSELLPEKWAIFKELKQKVLTSFERNGFWEIETPIIERGEVLLAKAGGETEKQIYRVSKVEEGAGQALRFDHTVPLARYVAEHQNELNFPFRATQIGRNFRGERAQKGRLREFYQCDVDIIGSDLSLCYDAEVIRTLAETLAEILPKTEQAVMMVSNRKILMGLIEELELNDKSTMILGVIDKRDKIGEEKVLEILVEEVGEEKALRILEVIRMVGKDKLFFENLRKIGVKNKMFQEGVEELELLAEMIEGVEAEFDMAIVRGLDYYTGTVFETKLINRPEAGSVCSGGRYENLTSNFSKRVFPGVGGSIGLSRLFAVLENEFVAGGKLGDLVVMAMSEKEYLVASKIAKMAREKGMKVAVLVIGKKVGEELAIAEKNYEFAMIIGEEEASGKKEIRMKNLQSRTEVGFLDYLGDKK